jgi:hypothetical protein
MDEIVTIGKQVLVCTRNPVTGQYGLPRWVTTDELETMFKASRTVLDKVTEVTLTGIAVGSAFIAYRRRKPEQSA